ncbi:MAG: S24 family peptidase [Planctomycetes bacterium]|nr:S24 family peptidase [Planctomycetota bacterium]
MEPTLHSGDLVVIRRQDEYAVGDIVSIETPIGPVMV